MKSPVFEIQRSDEWMVKVFRTNVTTSQESGEILADLQSMLPEVKVNFDLEDCDHILLVAGMRHWIDFVQDYLLANGYVCEVLD